ncbi:MAG: sigma 54-interacting transcriptional regulator [Acidobacteriota bacterium]
MSEARETLLIVDDEESIRTILSEKLSGRYEVRTATDGDDALRLLEARPSDLMLCDVKMPGRDGLSTLAEVIKRHPETAVVMITALLDVDVAVRALKLGAYDYITKPFHLEEVSLAVERALEKRHLRQENREYQTRLETRVREQTERIETLLTQEARARVLDSIYKAADMVSAYEDPERTLNSLLGSVVELVGADRGAVLTKASDGQPRFAATVGLEEADREGLLTLGRDLVSRDEVLCATADGFPDEIREHPFVRSSQLVSLAHAPLRHGGEDFGGLYVDSRKNAFDLSMVGPEFFGVFAKLASGVVHAARSHGALRASVAALQDEVDKVYRHDDLVGGSPVMQDVFRLVDKVKSTDTTVLVLGESGTGKEKIARLIHHLSPRAASPFVAVNCAAIPSELLEAELFGIEKGIATGVTARPGKFEVANGGTIFLDEVGDLSAMAQAKLLRVLQERTLERVGSSTCVELDLRVLAATNVDLREAVEAKNFREDLFYRLNVLPIYLPPLRERREDIAPLVRYFVDQFCREQKKPLLEIDDEAMDSFVQASWPGNIRELKNALERAVILSEGDALVPHQELRGPSRGSGGLDLGAALDLDLSERDLVATYAKEAFDRFRRYDRTSDFLGISFKTLKKRLADAEARTLASPTR